MEKISIKRGTYNQNSNINTKNSEVNNQNSANKNTTSHFETLMERISRIRNENCNK